MASKVRADINLDLSIIGIAYDLLDRGIPLATPPTKRGIHGVRGYILVNRVASIGFYPKRVPSAHALAAAIFHLRGGYGETENNYDGINYPPDLRIDFFIIDGIYITSHGQISGEMLPAYDPSVITCTRMIHEATTHGIKAIKSESEFLELVGFSGKNAPQYLDADPAPARPPRVAITNTPLAVRHEKEFALTFPIVHRDMHLLATAIRQKDGTVTVTREPSEGEPLDNLPLRGYLIVRNFLLTADRVADRPLLAFNPGMVDVRVLIDAAHRLLSSFPHDSNRWCVKGHDFEIVIAVMKGRRIIYDSHTDVYDGMTLLPAQSIDHLFPRLPKPAEPTVSQYLFLLWQSLIETGLYDLVMEGNEKAVVTKILNIGFGSLGGWYTHTTSATKQFLN